MRRIRRRRCLLLSSAGFFFFKKKLESADPPPSSEEGGPESKTRVIVSFISYCKSDHESAGFFIFYITGSRLSNALMSARNATSVPHHTVFIQGIFKLYQQLWQTHKRKAPLDNLSQDSRFLLSVSLLCASKVAAHHHYHRLPTPQEDRSRS